MWIYIIISTVSRYVNLKIDIFSFDYRENF